MMKLLQELWKSIKTAFLSKRETNKENTPDNNTKPETLKTPVHTLPEIPKITTKPEVNKSTIDNKQFIQPNFSQNFQEKTIDTIIIEETTEQSLEKVEKKRIIISPLRNASVGMKTAHVQVGLDFGTSSTKIAYRTLGGRTVKPLVFDHGLAAYPEYCLPSLIAFDEQGKIRIGIEAAHYQEKNGRDSGIKYLKMLVAGKYEESFRDLQAEEAFNNYINKRCGKNSSITIEELTTIYLTYVMAMAREVINKSDEFANCQTDVAFNICMPIDYIQNNKVKRVFQRIFQSAEAFEKDGYSQCSEDEYFEKIRKLGSTVISESNGSRVFDVPEAVAQIASYQISLKKQEGKHAILDFGAGTTDISIFNLIDAEKGLSTLWYAARNLPHGSAINERIIAEHLKRNNKYNSEFNDSDILDVLTALSFKLQNKEFPFDSSFLSSVKKDIEKELWTFKRSQDYYRTWGTAYRMEQLQSSWYDVKILLCGGGSSLPSISSIFSEPWWQNLGVDKYDIDILPEPDDYDSYKGTVPFQRMAVAYGLTIPIPQLEEYILPQDCPNQTPRRYFCKRPDRDDLYPK